MEFGRVLFLVFLNIFFCIIWKVVGFYLEFTYGYLVDRFREK